MIALSYLLLILVLVLIIGGICYIFLSNSEQNLESTIEMNVNIINTSEPFEFNIDGENVVVEWGDENTMSLKEVSKNLSKNLKDSKSLNSHIYSEPGEYTVKVKTIKSSSSFTFFEANAVDKINKIIKMNINSTSITTFRVPGNDINNLEVSNLKSLVELDVSKNKLALLDLSKLRALQNLNASENQLTTLNLTNNTNLGTLKVANNQIANFDFQANPNLLDFDLTGNPIEILKLNILQEEAVKIIKLNNANLNSFDTQNLKNIESLSLNDNNISTFEVKNFDTLNNLEIASNRLTNLLNPRKNMATVLNVKSNQLTSIDLTNWTNLRELIVRDNLLTTLDLTPAASQIEEIDASVNQISSLNLTDCNSIKFLSLTNNNLDQTSIDNILVKIRNNNLLSPDDDTLRYSLLLTGNVAPSATGLFAKTYLIAVLKWNVETD